MWPYSKYYKESDVYLSKELGCLKTCMPIKTGGSADLVRLAHSLGLEVSGWTGNTIQDIDTFIEWGVDSFTTDFPSIALSHLSRG